MRVLFVLWHGDIGGAERITVALAGQLRRISVDASVLFVGGAGRLGAQLLAEEVPHQSLDLGRGRDLITHPGSLRRSLHRLRPDVVVVVEIGFIGATVRATGFRGPIVGVEHGALIRLRDPGRLLQAKRWANRLSGVLTYDAEVAISRYMRDLVGRRPHVRRVALIPHGVDVAPTPQPLPPGADREIVVGFAGRLFPGKGLDRLLEAVAILARGELGHRVSVLVAGDGEMRVPWERLARDLGVLDRVAFLGWTDDIAAHWSRCHVAVAPNDDFTESFCMSMLEAMAVGRATIVTDGGGLPELVIPGHTGQVVPRRDDGALADALAAYVRDPRRIAAEGAAAHERAARDYSLAQSAQSYLTLAEELLNYRRARAARTSTGSSTPRR